MPRSRKINREKVQASLDKVCPKCGALISPAEVRRIDFERIECSVCGERFAPVLSVIACSQQLISAVEMRSARPTDQFGAAMLGMRGIQRSSRNKATTLTESLLCSKHPFVPHGPADQMLVFSGQLRVQNLAY
jgi:hypothetical protein